MDLIAHKLSAGGKTDRLECVRADGSRCEVMMPRQRILPHDLIHAVVESRLGLDNGFIGLVAKGADIDFAAQEFHSRIDPAKHAQVAQAESLVESLQAQLWNGQFDEDAFRYGVNAACVMRGVAAPDLAAVDVRRDIFDATVALCETWGAVPENGSWRLRFPLAVERG